MKFLFFVLFALICVGYIVVDRQVQSGIQTAIADKTVIMGMTEADAKKSLGEPLETKSTTSFWGREVVMTFDDGNEVTFMRGKAVKIQTVQLNSALLQVQKAVTAKKDREAGRTTPEPKRGEWMWKGYKNPLDRPTGR
ncbi:MAG: hypothetical protein ABIZ56_08295 [Chthoniobacteraceae bacterium]